MNTDMLKWLWIEIERFRVGSEDPSAEPVTIDMLQTIIERVADTYGVDARQTPEPWRSGLLKPRS